MRKINLLACLAIVLLGTTLLSAQATRTWVSGVGDDANPCSRTAPCKTFAGAISKTAPGGEIDALDPGGFGALTITKSITLDGGGGQVASVLVAGTNGIVVAGGATDVVIIRNIRLDGLLGNGSNSGNAGINGIRWISGKTLIIENCVIFGFNNNGIDIEKSDGVVGDASIINTTVENNAQSGIFSKNTANVAISIDRSTMVHNNWGVQVQDNTKASVRESNASNNFAIGFLAQAAAGGTNALLDITSSMSSHNAINGVQAGGNNGTSTVSLNNVSVFDNGQGFLVGINGTIQSFGNNFITNAGTGSLTKNPPAPQ